MQFVEEAFLCSLIESTVCYFFRVVFGDGLEWPGGSDPERRINEPVTCSRDVTQHVSGCKRDLASASIVKLEQLKRCLIEVLALPVRHTNTVPAWHGQQRNFPSCDPPVSSSCIVQPSTLATAMAPLLWIRYHRSVLSFLMLFDIKMALHSVRLVFRCKIFPGMQEELFRKSKSW